MRYNKAIIRKTTYYLTSLIQIPDELTLEDFKIMTDSKEINCEILSSCDRELKIIIYHHNHKKMLADYMYIRSQEDFGFEPEITAKISKLCFVVKMSFSYFFFHDFYLS